MEYLFFVFSYLLACHLAFQKKDAFFVFRSFSLLLVISVLVYEVQSYLALSNNLNNYTVGFLLFAIPLLSWRYYKSRTFKFLIGTKKDLQLKSLLFLAGLIILLFFSIFLHAKGNILIPQYTSIDASVHFRYATKILTEASPASYAPFYTLGELLRLNHQSLLDKIIWFQSINIITYILVSLYLFFLGLKNLKLNSTLLKGLLFLLTIFGFLFNIFLTGFIVQLIGLGILVFFVDLYSELKKNIPGKLALGIIGYSLILVYIYWFPLLIMIILWDVLFNLKIQKKTVIPYLILFFVAYKFIPQHFTYTGLFYTAQEEGETYKIFLANFVILLPFIGYALHYIFQKDKKSKQSTFFLLSLASIFFFLILTFAYYLNFASSYTLAKSYFILGPSLFFLTIYGIEKLSKKLPRPKLFQIFITFIVVGVIGYYYLQNDPPNITEQKLLPSFNKENIFSLKIRPLDIFYFNAQAYKDQSNKKENFVRIDSKKIVFFEKINEYLRQDNNNFEELALTVYDPNKLPKITVVSDMKTSFWLFATTDILNKALDDYKTHSEKVVDYQAWLKNPRKTYLILLDTQTTNRWLWLNQTSFTFDDFDIIYKQGHNYLLKLKDPKN